MLEVQKYLENKVKSGLTELEAFACLNTELGIKVKHYDKENITLLDYDQIESPKTHPIVIECRSLILFTDDFQVVSMKFPRFFNYGEAPEYYVDFDWKNAVVMEKADGSLCGVYCLNGKWHISTRGMAFAEGPNQLGDGTFQQDIIEAFGLKDYEEFNNRFNARFNESCTYIFEYCSPKNRIVTKYEEPVMVLTGVTDRDESMYSDNMYMWELPYVVEDMQESGLNVRFPVTYDLDEPHKLITKANSLEGLQEGFVIWDQKTNKRCKIKSQTYIVAHTLRGNDTVPTRKNLLKLILTGEVDEFVAYFPEWKDAIDSVQSEVDSFRESLFSTYDDFKGLESQKDFAIAIKDVKGNGLLFSARKQGKSISQVISETPTEKMLNFFI